MLARTGLLRDRPYTVGFTRDQQRFLGCFAEEGYRPDAVVEDGWVVTAQGQAFVEFGLRVGERLGVVKNPAVRAFYTGQLNRRRIRPVPDRRQCRGSEERRNEAAILNANGRPSSRR